MLRFLVVAQLLVVAIASIVCALPANGFLQDDAFITFRYAANLAVGDGFAFNPGDRLLGTTTPLYAATLAALQAGLGLDPPRGAVVLHVTAYVGLALVARAFAGSTVGAAWAGTCAGLLALTPQARDAAGMESVTFVAAGFATLLLAVRGRAFAAGAAAAALCLIRPDGIVVAGLVTVHTALETRRIPWRTIVGGLVVGLPWLAFATIWFGSPLPGTVAAKYEQGESALWDVDFASLLWDDLLAPRGGVWLAAGLAALAAWRGGAPGRLVLAWAVLHNGLYVVTGVPGYPWYFLPVVGQAAFLLTWLTSRLADRVDRGATDEPTTTARRTRHELVALVVLVIALVSVVVGRADTRGSLVPRTLAPEYNRYLDIARWLEASTPREASLATTEVGILGYYSNRHIVDFLGLVTPGLADRVADRTNLETAMREHEPTWVLVHEPVWPTLEFDLPRLVGGGGGEYVMFRAVEDCRLWLRYRRHPTELAREIAAAAPPGAKRVALAWWPTTVDARATVAELGRARPGLELDLRPSAPDAEAWLRLHADGVLRAEPPRSPVDLPLDPPTFERTWTVQGAVAPSVDDSGVSWASAASLVLRTRVEIDGPVRMVRLTVAFGADGREPPPPGAVAAASWATIASSNPAVPRATTAAWPSDTQPTARDEHRVDLVLPPRSIIADDTLIELTITPLLGAGGGTLRAVELVR